MKKIVIIGAGEFQNPLIVRAKELGFEAHVFAWESGDIGEKTADYFYPVSITEKEKILEVCRKIKPDAVTTIASDLATVTVGYVAQALGLPCNSEQCIRCSTNKYEMRKAFQEAGIKTPGFYRISNEEELESLSSLTYPLIIKPVDRSGSRGIAKVHSQEQAKKAARKAIEHSFEKMAIAEEFIDGPEYSCECISQNGNHHFLAFTKKYTTGAPRFIETGHMQPSDIPEQWQDAIKTAVFSALDALKVTTGASHAEFRLSGEGEPTIIEIGARMGGDCIGSHLVRLSTGYDFLRMVIEAAQGKKLTIERGAHSTFAVIRFLFTQEDILTEERLEADLKGLICEKSPIRKENLSKATDSSTRAGYYIVAGDDKQAVKRMLQL